MLPLKKDLEEAITLNRFFLKLIKVKGKEINSANITLVFFKYLSVLCGKNEKYIEKTTFD